MGAVGAQSANTESQSQTHPRCWWGCKTFAILKPPCLTSVFTKTTLPQSWSLQRHHLPCPGACLGSIPDMLGRD